MEAKARDMLEKTKITNRIKLVTLKYFFNLIDCLKFLFFIFLLAKRLVPRNFSEVGSFSEVWFSLNYIIISEKTAQVKLDREEILCYYIINNSVNLGM